MQPYFAASSLNRFVGKTASSLHQLSVKNSSYGRLLALPYGLLLCLVIPFAKLALVMECLLTLLANLLGASFHPSCSLQDGWKTLQLTGFAFLGGILSPLVGIFVGVSTFSSLMIDPVKSSRVLVRTGKRHPSNRRPSSKKL